MDAVIFDMDGVISDTERLHGIAEHEILSKYGIGVTPQEMSRRFAGIPEKKVWEILFEEYGKGLPPERTLSDAKFDIMSAISAKNIHAIAGSIELIQAVNNAGIPCAIASSSGIEFINIVINELKIQNLFQALCSGTEVKNGKPAPDVFLLAAKKLKAIPSKCIVIEDATSGVTGAKAAGMKCIGFKAEGSLQDLSRADLLVNDLRKVNLDTLRSM